MCHDGARNSDTVNSVEKSTPWRLVVQAFQTSADLAQRDDFAERVSRFLEGFAADHSEQTRLR